MQSASDSLTRTLADIARKHDKPFLVEVGDGLMVTRIIVAIEKSLQAGGVVEI